MARILAVDDEVGILILIRNILIKDGHSVTTLSEPEQITALNPGFFDLILLDVMMPGIDGFALCERIRGIVDCPILFLTAKTLEDDIMYGLGLGADDYILKPFGTGELRARVNAHLRREQRERRSMLSIDEVHFNLLAKEMHVQEDKVPLTKSEYKICEFLARNRGQVFSKEKIYESVFGFDGESDSAAVAEHVKNIRAKLARYEQLPIETIWGIGYKWRT
ncbi:DNA-binding response regulator [Bacillus sp. FJAT-27264]|uniref:response regulator transcription factor n=1 Tax=Paenibacillus sp. (strain DSM 101736 / FJAT-27264) TaxID=1850362 RepID=UPI000807B58E|nr:response regulator transcription factor [Bacillus sp. FJAT-27264]OBZ18421.1 DNA-binding response regulator [Bacillus sp. FJAT-27264]